VAILEQQSGAEELERTDVIGLDGEQPHQDPLGLEQLLFGVALHRGLQHVVEGALIELQELGELGGWRIRHLETQVASLR
jgi:hypothetical protein